MKRAACSIFVFIVFIILSIIQTFENFNCIASVNTVRVYGRVLNIAWFPIPDAEVKFISSSDTTSTITDSSGEYEVYLSSLSTYVENSSSSEAFILNQNYPNPFNPNTIIMYELKRSARVKLYIYNITGQLIRELVNGFKSQGIYYAAWNGLDDYGNGVSAGVYLYRFQADRFTQTKKMLLLDGYSTGEVLSYPGSLQKNIINAEKPTARSHSVIVEAQGFKKYKEDNFIVSDNIITISKDFMLERNYMPIDTDTYKIDAEPADLHSCPGGGGLYILIMTPKEDFEGEIRLSINTDQLLNTSLTSEVFSIENQISEVTIRPDTTLTKGIRIVQVVSLYEGVADTLTLSVGLQIPVPTSDYAKARKNEFLEWLETYHPEFGITKGQEWFYYRKDTMLVGGDKYTLLNELWDMTVSWGTFPQSIITAEMLLRPRGKIEHVFHAKREADGSIHEIH